MVVKMQAKNRIIVAIDSNNLDDIRKIVLDLKPYVGCFKIGLEVTSSIGGPRAIEYIHSLGGRVFFDGKYNDIPNTVGKASKAISQLGVSMFNVHASCGEDSMRAAVKNKGKSTTLAVTVLTSTDNENCQKIFGSSVKNKVPQLAMMAKNAGIDGIICSAQDLEYTKEYPDLDSLLKITPGIRSAWAAINDQKRIATPAEAIKNGADFLVIGRQITDPPAKVGTMIKAAILTAEEIELAIQELPAR